MNNLLLAVSLSVVFSCSAVQTDDAYSAIMRQGIAYGEKGDLDRALAEFDKAIRLDPRRADAYYNRGVTYAEKSDHDRAIADYNKSIQT